eukprot:TRINITY_DN3526_c0_g1_i1.p1 TRINITY_DN3526_c0_g1~~TRINITY_DN3526_c0_g1_i1.p1  ORF type:complete len:239 (+),score=58.64 TRINITY_DN3526_c0_g1_i1:316-1032(+)
MIVVGFLRTFVPTLQEKLFFAALKGKQPQLSQKLETIKIEYDRDYILQFSKRMALLLGKGTLIWIASQLPYVGSLAVPIAQFVYTRRIFGPPAAGVFAVAPIFFSSWRPYAAYILRTLIATNALSRELFDPYLARLRKSSTPKSITEQSDELYLLRRYHGTLLGFALPFELLFSVPILGLPCFGIAQAAAPAVLVDILQRNKTKTLHHQYLLGEAEVEGSSPSPTVYSKFNKSDSKQM